MPYEPRGMSHSQLARLAEILCHMLVGLKLSRPTKATQRPLCESSLAIEHLFYSKFTRCPGPKYTNRCVCFLLRRTKGVNFPLFSRRPRYPQLRFSHETQQLFCADLLEVTLWSLRYASIDSFRKLDRTRYLSLLNCLPGTKIGHTCRIRLLRTNLKSSSL